MWPLASSKLTLYNTVTDNTAIFCDFDILNLSKHDFPLSVPTSTAGRRRLVRKEMSLSVQIGRNAYVLRRIADCFTDW